MITNITVAVAVGLIVSEILIYDKKAIAEVGTLKRIVFGLPSRLTLYTIAGVCAFLRLFGEDPIVYGFLIIVGASLGFSKVVRSKQTDVDAPKK